jgi:hypothetical protein
LNAEASVLVTDVVAVDTLFEVLLEVYDDVVVVTGLMFVVFCCKPLVLLAVGVLGVDVVLTADVEFEIDECSDDCEWNALLDVSDLAGVDGLEF